MDITDNKTKYSVDFFIYCQNCNLHNIAKTNACHDNGGRFWKF